MSLGTLWREIREQMCTGIQDTDSFDAPQTQPSNDLYAALGITLVWRVKDVFFFAFDLHAFFFFFFFHFLSDLLWWSGNDASKVSVVCDATWLTPVLCRPLDLGADIVLHSTTKYIGGHSDLIGEVEQPQALRVDESRRSPRSLGIWPLVCISERRVELKSSNPGPAALNAPQPRSVLVHSRLFIFFH